MNKLRAFRGLIGVSQKDITPPDGIFARNWGAATHDTADGVHRRLMLTCQTFRQKAGQDPLVLIGADLGWWKNAGDECLFRQQILQQTGLPEANLMFCLAHTHAGPGLCLDDEAKPGGHLIRPYREELVKKSVAAIGEALASETQATLTWQYGVCDLAANREYPDPEGDRVLTGYHPGVPADHTLLVGKITDRASGATRGILVNYACHPTTLAWQNRQISPDFIGAMRELVEASTKSPCLFLQGASGELSPPIQFTGDTLLADRYGRQLGYAVLSTLESMEAPGHVLTYRGVVESGASLAMWEALPTEISVEMKTIMTEVEYQLKDFPIYAELEKEWKNCANHVLKERLWRKMCIRKAIGDGQSASVKLWIWQLGSSLLIGQPNEAFSCYQMEIRRKFPDLAIAVMNLANGSIGYLPPQDHYQLNTYPVWQTPFAAGSSDILRNTTLEAINQLLYE